MSISRLLTLIKFNISYYIKPRFKDEKAKKRYITTVILLGICLLLPLVEVVFVIYILASNLIQSGQLPEMLSSLFLLTQISTIVLGLVTYMQMMYFSKDNELLSTLPVTTSEIFISKIVTVMIMKMFISLIVVIPSTIVTAVAVAKAGITLSAIYYLLIPVAIVTMPMLPILVIAIISFPIMKIVSYFKKHPTLGAVVTVVLIVGLILAIYIPLYSNIYSTPTNEETTAEEDITSMIGGDTINKMIVMGKIGFHTLCFARAMLGENIAVNLLIYFGITIVAFVLGLLVSGLLYRKVVGSLNEGGGISRVKASKEPYKVLPIEKTLLKRELKVMVRDSKKFINVLMSLILTPVMVFIMIYIMKLSTQAAASAEESISIEGGLFLVGISTMFTMLMMGGSNAGVSVGFSLEGPSFLLFKTMPVSYKSIFKSKLLFNDVADLLSIIITALIVTIYAKLNVIDFIGFTATSFLFVISINSFALFRDLKGPKLYWSNIKEITKNNFTTMIPMLVAFPGGIVAMVASILLSMLEINPYLLSLIYWIIIAGISAIYYFTCRFGVYDKIDKYFEEVEC